MTDNIELSERYRAVADANRRMYAAGDTARDYARTILVDPEERQLLFDDLKRAMDVLGNLGRKVIALDCCGGPGTAGRVLQEFGCDTTLVDISPQMIQLYVQECQRRGWTANTHCSEIAAFFSSDVRKFDLMVFSSALHHLENPLLVLELAQRVLSPGGLIVTIFDPIAQSRLKRTLLEPARMMDRVWFEPSTFFKRAVPVLKRMMRGGSAAKTADRSMAVTDDNIGYIAEYHGDTGIDDLALVESITKSGRLRVLQHDRYTTKGGPAQDFMRRIIRSPISFKLLLQNCS